MRISQLKRLLVGTRMPLAYAEHERLSKTTALAVFSSDALSSVAYATEEILLILVLAATAAAHVAVPVSVVIASLETRIGKRGPAIATSAGPIKM